MATVFTHDLAHLRNRAPTIVSAALDNERTAAGAIGLDAKCFEIFRHRDFIRAIRRQLSFGAARKNRQV